MDGAYSCSIAISSPSFCRTIELVTETELTVADPGRATHRITRVIGGVDAVDVTADPAGRDQAMRLRHAGGRTSLTFAEG